MKATLEFTLPDEAEEHRCAVQGMDWRGIVIDLDTQLRAEVKYGASEMTPTKMEGEPLAATARRYLHYLVSDAGLSLDL